MRRMIACLLAGVPTVAACSQPDHQVTQDAYSKALFEAGVDFEAKRTGVTRDNLLSLAEPILFRLKGRSCVLFKPKPDVLGRQSVVCFDDESRKVVDSFSE